VFDGCQEGIGCRIIKFGKAYTSGEVVYLFLEDEECSFSVFMEGTFGDSSANIGVAVAIAADPTAEAKQGVLFGKKEFVGVETGVFPGIFEAPIALLECQRKDLGEVVHDVVSFGDDIRFFKIDLSGAPPAFEQGFDFVINACSLGFGPDGIFFFNEEEVNFSVQFED
jgi:hypothetical protein